MITVTSHSEPGGHPNNQDAVVTLAHPLHPDWLLAAVADGQGGRAGAAEAAQLACRTFRELVCRLTVRQLVQPGPWLSLLGEVDHAVDLDSQAGFCTFAAVGVTSTGLLGASSGDSAVVLFSAGQQMQVLTARQKKDPPVGSSAAEFIPFCASLTPPLTVLLLTDGVWKYVGWDFLRGLDPRQRGEELIRQARAKVTLPGSREPESYRGLQDDFTLVVLQAALGDTGGVSKAERG